MKISKYQFVFIALFILSNLFAQNLPTKFEKQSVIKELSKKFKIKILYIAFAELIT